MHYPIWSKDKCGGNKYFCYIFVRNIDPLKCFHKIHNEACLWARVCFLKIPEDQKLNMEHDRGFRIFWGGKSGHLKTIGIFINTKYSLLVNIAYFNFSRQKLD